MDTLGCHLQGASLARDPRNFRDSRASTRVRLLCSRGPVPEGIG
jgi:hypothetical protein